MKLDGLNGDVLFYIIEYLSTADALALSHTSRRIHPIAIDRAVSKVQFSKAVSSNKISLMCSFMLADIHCRARRLRTLDIEGNALLEEPIPFYAVSLDSRIYDMSSASLLANLLREAHMVLEMR